MIIAVDFDRTIADTDNPPKGYRIGSPLPNAKEALTKFREAGHKIIIHSCRSNDGERAIKVMTDYLNYFLIPYDEVWNQTGKPIADLYIDDKGYHFTSWTETESFVEKLTNTSR